jgi:hypothetical protein
LERCVGEKFEEWASQNAQPDTIASAAVAACREDWVIWRAMQQYRIEARGLRFRLSEFKARFKEELVNAAIVWVFEARSEP